MSEEENKETQNAGAQGGAPQSNGMATASLVLGIVSIALGWILAGIIGIITGILAIILAVVAKKKIKQNPNMGGKGSATGGLVTGIIGTVLYLAIWIIFTVIITSSVDTLKEIGESQEIQDAMKESIEKGLEDANNNK